MTLEQMERLRSDPGEFSRSVGAEPGRDRTLLYGYDTDRRTWHVYQMGGWLTRVIYIGSNPEPEKTLSAERLDARYLVPNKRLYPEACDYFFCRLLKSIEINLPFTTYGSLKRPEGSMFFGRTF
jgi:hypothetical protein